MTAKKPTTVKKAIWSRKGLGMHYVANFFDQSDVQYFSGFKLIEKDYAGQGYDLFKATYKSEYMEQGKSIIFLGEWQGSKNVEFDWQYRGY